MSDAPSAELLVRYRDRDQAAAEELFRRYAERLTALARSRLSSALAARVDPEDVVQSAYRSFFRLARDGGVELHESGDLWRLLARITLRKVCRTARRHRADCRSVEREQPGEDDALSHGPTPEDAAALLDELRAALAPLSPLQRRIVELRLHGHEAEAIAEQVGRSARTVRRTLTAVGAELQRRLIDPPPEVGLLDYGDIVLLKLVGQGGMGKVYRAAWRGHPTPVAVKLLRKPLRGHAEAAARFREEAAVLARLRHPGIVPLHGVGLLPDGGHFLVMDLIEGTDLSRVSRPGVEQALRWVAEAADAVDHAHWAGVVHCDLKPANLLLGADGHIRVSDFGLARSLGRDDTPRGGTPGFMAPEQRSPAGVVTPRTDVFGLGAVLRALLPAMPPEAEAICRRCLGPDPAGRYATAADVAAALRNLTATAPAPPAGPPPARPPAVGPPLAPP